MSMQLSSMFHIPGMSPHTWDVTSHRGRHLTPVMSPHTGDVISHRGMYVFGCTCLSLSVIIC